MFCNGITAIVIALMVSPLWENPPSLHIAISVFVQELNICVHFLDAEAPDEVAFT